MQNGLSFSEGQILTKLSFVDGQLLAVIQEKVAEGTTRPIPAFTRRDVRIPALPNKAFAVIGMRRAGKTTFLWQIAHDLLQRGAPREQALYFSFEDERLLDLHASDLQHIIEHYYHLYPHMRDRQRVMLLLDEIQLVPSWETFVRRIMDSEMVEVYLSGSSARMLAYEIAASMRGRALPVVIFPFSFREYLRHLGEEPTDSFARLPKAQRSALHAQLVRYLETGGFPEAVELETIDRRELLTNYVDSVILRDVVERYRINNLPVLRRLTRQLLGNPGMPFSVNKFYNELRSQGFSVSKDSLHAMVGHLEDAFLVRSVPFFSYSQAQQRSNPRKIYPIDTGFIPFYTAPRPLPLGHALETCVLIEYLRQRAEMAYWRTPAGYEVDFVAQMADGTLELVQVCASLSDAATHAREVRALLDAQAHFPHAQLRIITMDTALPTDAHSSIIYSYAVEWLLG